MKRVLAIGAHFDDIELGCGGALARHIDEGDTVFGFVATDSGYSDLQGNILREEKAAKEEGYKAAAVIGYELLTGNIPTYMIEPGEDINRMLLKIIEKNKIDTIYTHWDKDVHHDHRNLAEASLHVSKHVNRILMYKSNWYDSSECFITNFYVDISKTWERKERAIRCYDSEMKRVGEKWISFFCNQAINYGFKNGVKYAEGFRIVKWLY